MMDIREEVFQAMGAASACWDNLEGAGVFESEKCKAIADELVGKIESEIQQPRLGFATTRQLLAEITARVDVIGQLDYMTVGGE